MVLSVHAGHTVGYLLGPVATGRENYYTGAVAAGEPAGLWYGAGAEALGLTGEVDGDVMTGVYSRLEDPRNPDGDALAPAHRRYKGAEERYRELVARHPDASPEKRAALRAEAERTARQAVSFVDLTFSPVKSVTVLAVAFERMENDARAAGDLDRAAAWGAYREAVEAAVMAGARASIDYLQDTAGYARVGNHAGKSGRWADSHRWVVAQFLQHDSRDRDPQLHVHQAVLNLQQDDAGRWWRLDTVAIRQQHHAAGAVGTRVMEAELARAIGMRFEARPDGQREVVGIPTEVLELFSQRRRAITPRVAELARAFTERFGREPSRLELAQMSQRATLETRARKSHDGETLEQRLDRWEQQARARLVGGLGEVARSALAASPGGAGEPARWSSEDVIERAVAGVAERREKWVRADLMRAVSEALPANLGIRAQDVRPLLESLTDAALERALRLTPDEVGAEELPDELRLANGASAYRRPGQVRYTTAAQVAGERLLRAAAVERGAAAVPVEDAQRVIERYRVAGVELGVDQAAAVRGVLTDAARVGVLAAPAGTGKSFTVGAIAGAWRDAGHRVHGLAPSQVAAQVLADEGLDAWNTARWIGAQARGGRGECDPPALQAGDLVVVDEAGMTSTTDLAAIVETVREADAKLLLVGDDRQLAAVGPGGAFADVAERAVRYELAEVRRFRNDWERGASLRLRDGDAEVLGEYDRAGRLVDGGTPEQASAAAARRWLADTVQGRESLLIVPTNEEAARVSAQLRAELVRLGRVSSDAAVQLGRDGNAAGSGDVVQARHNAWDLRGWQGNTTPPINRETYRVITPHAVGGLEVEHTRTGTRVTLPPEYVREHLVLAYASTVHAAQGRTVDTAHAVTGKGTDAAGLYVAMTRGRESNTAYVVTRPTADDDPSGVAQDVEQRAPRAVLADILERARQDRAALAEAESLTEEAHSTATLLERLAVEAAQATAGRAGQLLDAAAATGAISDEQRIAFAADPAMGTLERLMRQVEVAGHDPAEVLSRALQGELDTAVRPAAVVQDRIRKTVDLSVQLESAHSLIPRAIDEQWRTHLEHLADAADARRVELGQRAAEESPGWAVEALGPVPEDPVARAEWEHRAGWAAAHRELVGHDDLVDPLGDAPPPLLLEKHAMWRTAHAALDLPDRGPAERQASDGQLRCRVVAAARERAWAPRWVADALAATAERLEDVRASAALLLARARSEDQGEQDREELLAAAEDAEREAGELERTVERLRYADDTRAQWSLHAGPTLEEGERSRVELAARGVDLEGEPKVTAEEWLAEHREAMTAEDPHRVVTAADVDDAPDDAGEVLAAADEDRAADVVVETALPDLREVAVADALEYADPEGGTRQVPTADEVAAVVERARLVELEMAARAGIAEAATEGGDPESGPALQDWADEAADDADVEDEVMA